jgi:acetoacetate decarboxylase
VSAIHILADLTLGLGRVVHDYLQQSSRQTLRINEMALAT